MYLSQMFVSHLIVFMFEVSVFTNSVRRIEGLDLTEQFLESVIAVLCMTCVYDFLPVSYPDSCCLVDCISNLLPAPAFYSLNPVLTMFHFVCISFFLPTFDQD